MSTEATNQGARTPGAVEALRKEIEARRNRAESLSSEAHARGRDQQEFFRNGQVDAFEQVLALLPASPSREGGAAHG